jgi:hypothetical protein
MKGGCKQNAIWLLDCGRRGNYMQLITGSERRGRRLGGCLNLRKEDGGGVLIRLRSTVRNGKKIEGGGRIGRFVGGREVNIVVY